MIEGGARSCPMKVLSNWESCFRWLRELFGFRDSVSLAPKIGASELI